MHNLLVWLKNWISVYSRHAEVDDVKIAQLRRIEEGGVCRLKWLIAARAA
jgi:hypothetical protein